MKTTLTISEKKFNTIAFVFGALLLGALIYALCKGNLTNLSLLRAPL